MYKIIILWITMSLCPFSKTEAQSFKPPIHEFCGYLHHIFNADIDDPDVSFSIITSSKEIALNFKYDKSTKSFYWQDSSIIMIFYGSWYPSGTTEMNTLYHNKSETEYLMSMPHIIKAQNKKVFINPMDSTKYYHYTSRKKIHFTAFDYEDYKPYEQTYGQLKKSFGLFGKGYILPDMVKSGNKTYIVNYFYKKSKCK
jgi:hypothetical protein